MKLTSLFLACSLLLTGCTAIIEHFDPKNQAYQAMLKHAKHCPECGQWLKDHPGQPTPICKHTEQLIPELAPK